MNWAKYIFLTVTQTNGGVAGSSQRQRRQAATMGHHATGYKCEDEGRAMFVAKGC